MSGIGTTADVPLRVCQLTLKRKFKKWSPPWLAIFQNRLVPLSKNLARYRVLERQVCVCVSAEKFLGNLILS